jgi:hypothetical protein
LLKSKYIPRYELRDKTLRYDPSRLQFSFATSWTDRLPVASAATPVSAAAEQQHDYDDDQK